MVEPKECAREKLSNFISSLNQVFDVAGEEAEQRFKNCEKLGKESLKQAIDRYLENFADGLEIIYK
jgi:ElaB/YqjD/DUF883 family membrane-anchored ribosome-binding protein